MNERYEHDSGENLKNNFYSISKLMNEKQSNSNSHLDEENSSLLNEKEVEQDLNDSHNSNSESSIECDLNEYIKSKIGSYLNELNQSREDFDRITKQIIEKTQSKYSLIPRNQIVKLVKKALSLYDLEYSLSECESNSPEIKQSRASSSSGYNSIPSPSSSSSSNSSQKHSLKSDFKNNSKKLKTEFLKNNLFDPKTLTSKPQLSNNNNNNMTSTPPLNSFPTWNSNLFDPEFLRMAANSNPLLRFPDLNSFNPYLNNLNQYSNLFRPNVTPSQQFPISPQAQNLTKKETPVVETTSKITPVPNQNGLNKLQSMRLQPNKNDNNLASALASSKFKLSSKLSKLSSTEIQTVKSLINSYRESAAFLSRSADELEQLINEYHDN
ncbi:unnamed protein product [Brachionus calyciflorus]|uniref:Uncharacterized protein n=1 Tax=Brachionus calyciflorus TaxID=104777 RepID=A0A814DP53_9BILA|nr:unnamed protein product [Brachionus calyciflorus]